MNTSQKDLKMREYRSLGMLVVLMLLPILAFAQNDVMTSYNIFKLKHVLDVEISPDGSKAAYISTLPRSFSDKPGADYRELYLYDIASSKSKAIITGKHSVSAIQWSPDGSKFAVLSNIDTIPGMQIFEFSADGSGQKRISTHTTGVRRFQYSPDGKVIAYTGTEPVDKSIKDKIAWGFNAEIYEEDWQHVNLYVLDLSTKLSRKLTKDITVHNFDWNPDGSNIAAAVSAKNLVDFTYMFKRIFLIDPTNGHALMYIDNPGKLGQIQWSPNGKRLAFVSAVDVSDSKEGSIFIINTEKYGNFQTIKNYTKGFEGTVTRIAWQNDQTLLFSSEEGVDLTVRSLDIRNDEKPIVLEGGKIAFYDFSLGGNMLALNGSTPEHPAELFTFDLGTKTLKKCTNNNDWLSDVKLAKQEEIVYKAQDGLTIKGILVYPLNFEKERKNPELKNKRYPLIVTIHGGPEACYHNGWLTSYGNWAQIAAAQDYFVFLPNYRASTGRGVAYSKMGLGDLVGKEFQDVLDGIDVLVDKGYVDQSRVGMGGGSYGGYFAAWAATKHSERFAASCVFVGVTNQISKRHTTDIPFEDYHVHWGIWSHEDWMKMLERSPVYWAKGSKTPTLILHGTKDPRVHPSQSLELYRTMKVHGDNPVRLVWYPGEGHGNRKNPARLDFSLRTMRWFNYYLKGKPKTRKYEIPEKTLEIDSGLLH
jgi:dipeptidyl aminopeptidase/acylaminoacyl peptidase